MIARNRPLTTHQAAHALRVSPMTIVRWVNLGQLRAWKTVGGHRRIERADLAAFAQAQGFHGFTLDVAAPLALVPAIAAPPDLRAQVEELLATVPDVPDLDAGDHHTMSKHDRARWFALGLARGKANLRDAVRLLLRGEGP